MTRGTVLALGIMVGVMVAAWFLSRKAMQKNYEWLMPIFLVKSGSRTKAGCYHGAEVGAGR